MSEKETREAQMNLRFRPSLKLAIERAAEAERRSVNNLMEMAAAEYLKAHGHPEAVPAKRSRK